MVMVPLGIGSGVVIARPAFQGTEIPHIEWGRTVESTMDLCVNGQPHVPPSFNRVIFREEITDEERRGEETDKKTREEVRNDR